MQVVPIKPKLKPPGIKRLKLKSDEPLSVFGFKFNLRRYTKEYVIGNLQFIADGGGRATLNANKAGPGAGAAHNPPFHLSSCFSETTQVFAFGTLR